MAVARFSPFEALLLKSQNQRQSAELVLLAWVLVNKHEALEDDRQYLETLARRCHHPRDLGTLMASARRTDLDDIQLAAEVVARDSADTAPLFLRQAIALATSDGTLSLRNHHILRFLADLTRLEPADLARGFLEVTGRELQAPADLSRRSYWASIDDAADDPLKEEPREEEAACDAAQPPRSAARVGWRQRAREMADRQRQQRQQRRDEQRHKAQQEREKAQQDKRDADAREARERQTRAAQERAREEARQRREKAERQQEEAQRQQEQAQARAAFHVPYRLRLALIELELEADASASEIKRAYRRLAQRHHPDRFHGQSEWRMKLASQRFQRIKNAYELLMQHA